MIMLSNISSIGSLLDETLRVVRRYPLALLAAMLATAAAQFSFDHPGGWMSSIIMVCILAVPAFLAAEITMERYCADYRLRAFTVMAMFVSFGLFYFSHESSGQTVFWARWVQLLIAAVAALLVLPFVRGGTARQCWWHAAALFEGAVVGWFTAAVVFLGLAAGLSLFRYLFGVSLNQLIYMRIWIVCSLLLAPWIFMSFIPKDAAAAEDAVPYPRRLEKLSRHVFIPLVAVYMLLLYAYIVKIGIAREWPQGTLGYLIAGVSGLGLFTWLALYPIKDEAEGAPRWFAKGFFAALLPLLALLFLAVWRRVVEYGVTERRFFLGVYGVWMCALAIYFTFSRRKDPRWIPATLAILALATVAGPWGAYSLSARSQASRLEKVLVANGWLKDGRIVAQTGKVVADPEFKSVISAVDFLTTRNETSRIQSWTDEALAQKSSLEVRRALGLDSMTARQGTASSGNRYFEIYADQRRAKFSAVRGYDYVWYFTVPESVTVPAGNGKMELKSRITGKKLEITLDGSLARFDLEPLLNSALTARVNEFRLQVPEQMMGISTAAGGTELKVVLDSVRGNVRKDAVTVQGAQGFLLIKK